MLDHGSLLRLYFGFRFSVQIRNAGIRRTDLFLDYTFHNPALIA
jgi:hypothetical protein